MTPNDETPLQEILKLELDKYLDVLQEISSQASKEFALEKVMKNLLKEIFIFFDVKTVINFILMNKLVIFKLVWNMKKDRLWNNKNLWWWFFQALEKMKSDWENMHFSFVAYKDTGVSILSSPEDIQVLLDDHIVKTTTMKGSPFIEPFEAAVNEWDVLLVRYITLELVENSP